MSEPEVVQAASPPRENKKSCFCSWPFWLATFTALAITGVLLWYFDVFDKALDQVLPNFNETDMGDDDDQDNPIDPTVSPTAGSNSSRYEFNQCGDNVDNCCNGLVGLCYLPVNQVLFASLHNAFATEQDGFNYLYNHYFQLEEALEAGYRGLLLDLCHCRTGTYQFCHTVCGLGSRNPLQVLFNINSFLDQNPREVIIINLEISEDAELPVDLWDFWEIVQTVDGFADKLFFHEPQTPWPTLGTLVDLNQRILLFHHRGPLCETAAQCPLGLHQRWFDYTIETDFQLENVEAFETPDKCRITRGPGPVNDTSNLLFAVNHFLRIPDPVPTLGLNQRDVLESRLETCSSYNGGQTVNTLHLDFWSLGDAIQVTQITNRARVQNWQQANSP